MLRLAALITFLAGTALLVMDLREPVGAQPYGAVLDGFALVTIGGLLAASALLPARTLRRIVAVLTTLWSLWLKEPRRKTAQQGAGCAAQ